MGKRYLLAEDTINEADITRLAAWLQDTPWLTQGKLCLEFEQAWARWVGTNHAVFVNSGSSANLMMYYALLASDRLPNRRVVVPSIAWATTLAPAIQFGFEPIMCEADRTSFGLDLTHLRKLCEEHRPSAVIAVHVLGVPVDLEGLLALQKEFGFALMEDACAALGSRYDGKPVGVYGDLSSFSLYFGHQLSTIEGGMVCTDDEELYHLLLMLRSHGWAKDLPEATEQALMKRYNVHPFNRRFAFYHPGFNVRSTDLNAKIGLMQMEKADEVVGRRMENHRHYQNLFNGSPRFHIQRNERSEIASISFVALAEDGAHRDRIAKRLDEEQIETRPLGGGNMGRQPFWTDRYPVQELPFADRIHETAFHIPNHPSLTLQDIEHIAGVVLSVE